MKSTIRSVAKCGGSRKVQLEVSRNVKEAAKYTRSVAKCVKSRKVQLEMSRNVEEAEKYN